MQKVAISDGYGICLIQELRGSMDGHEFGQQGGNLFLGGGAGPCDAHFDFAWGIFENGNVPLQCSRNGNALRPSQLEHGLHVFAVEL